MDAITTDEAACVAVVDTESGRRFSFCGHLLIMIPLAVLDPKGGDLLLLAKNHTVGTLLFPQEGHEQMLRAYCQSLHGSTVA